MKANGWWFLAAPLDIAYLTCFFFVLSWPGLSYALLFGLVVGLAAARQWWVKLVQTYWQAGLLAGSLVLPFTAWVASTRASGPGLSGPRQGGAHRVALAFMLSMVLAASASGFLERRILGPALAPAEVSAVDTLNRSLALAAASYGSARLVDRGIALVSEAELTLPVIGGVAVKPGQFFKPLQDMAERYSDIMVVAMASVGIQRVLLELGHNAAVVVLGSAVAISLLFALLMPALSWRLARLARGMLVLLIVARLMVPLSVVGVGVVSDTVLDERRFQAQQQLDIATAELQQADIESGMAQDSGLMAWLGDLRDETADMALNVRQFSDDMVDRFIQLLVVYLLETLLLPLGMLVILGWIVRNLALPPATVVAAERQRLH